MATLSPQPTTQSIPATAVYRGATVLVHRNTLRDGTVEVTPAVSSSEWENLHPVRRESLSGGRSRVNVAELSKPLTETERAYVANCRIRTLADAMKDCGACKFNVGLK